MTQPSRDAATPLRRTDARQIGPEDPRYRELLRRGFNKRFEGTPDCVCLPGSTSDVVAAVQLASDTGRRVAVRSGGHCLEGFVADPAIRILIDLSAMSAVAWDPAMRAFMIESGATVGRVHRALYLGWGVVLPLGQSPDIGIGGHVLGSAFGFIHREHGLAADHLYAVECVVVDESGVARAVIATREPDDPNRELWWAHTGGGGGNFGVVTRYWFRSWDADGSRPEDALPRAPVGVATLRAEWAWDELDERSFSALLRRYEGWAEAHADPASPHTMLFSVLTAGCAAAGGGVVLRALSIAGHGAEKELEAHLRSVTGELPGRPRYSVANDSWTGFACNPFPDLFGTSPGGTAASAARLKLKDALLKRRHTDQQLHVLYSALVDAAAAPGGGIGVATYGGRMNALPPDATAAAQRNSALDTACTVGWGDASQEEPSVEWVRHLYQRLFEATGGVPVPGPMTEGALINHPDTDLADATWNRSGVPWSTIYYLDNYPRLQQAKARWDPHNLFHHALSIVLPTGVASEPKKC